MFLTMTGRTIQSLKYTFSFSPSLLTINLPFYALIDSCGGGMRVRCQLQLLDLYLEISVFVPLVPGSSGGSALLPGPGPGLVLVSKALHCAARPGPGCQQDHASTGCLHSASK